MSAETMSSIPHSACNNIYTLNNANASTIELISGQKAIEEIERIDDFVKNFSPFDVEARLHRSSCTAQDYLKFVGQQILDWDKVSTQIISSSIEFINTTCTNKLKLLIYPSRVYIVLTNGKDENNASYCRNENVIVLSLRMLYSSQLSKILLHELFHIWSRWHTNIAIRDQLYASIGYHKIPEDKLVALPPSLNAVKMTNPDAPNTMKYFIELEKCDDETRTRYKCTPILHASRPFDKSFSTNFFHYLVATTLILDDTTYQPLQPLTYLPYEQAVNFRSQIGNNTDYIIHPEEILADNFTLWMTSTDNLQDIETPSIISQMNDIICATSGTAQEILAEESTSSN